MPEATMGVGGGLVSTNTSKKELKLPGVQERSFPGPVVGMPTLPSAGPPFVTAVGVADVRRIWSRYQRLVVVLFSSKRIFGTSVVDWNVPIELKTLAVLNI